MLYLMYEDVIFANAAYSYQEPVHVSDYDLDKNLSNDDMSVYYSPGLKKAVVAYRGTRPTNLKDLAADYAIATDKMKYHPRFRRAAKLAKTAIEKYGKENVRLTGHSLGGSLALFANEQLGSNAVETTVFNPGYSPITSVRQVLSRKNPRLKEKTKIYAHAKDLVSKGAHHKFGAYDLYLMKDKRGDALSKHGLGTFLNVTEREFNKV